MKPLKWYKRLESLKGRIEAGVFLVEGERAIRQVAGSRPKTIIEILYTEESSDLFADCPRRLLTKAQFHDLSSAVTPQGLIAVVSLPQDIYSDTLPDNPGRHILLLEDIQDPGNVGTLIRTAAAFGFCGIILSDKCADPFSPKCVQSTAGSILFPWLRRTAGYLDMASSLIGLNYTLMATDLRGSESPEVFNQEIPLILALGNEASGLSPEVLNKARHRIKIPINPEAAESLNVAAGGAICMYLVSRKS
jgi:TrmH family RNA methyltransferase